MQRVCVWVEAEGHEPLPWDEPSLFLPGEHIFAKLIKLSREIDAAILIFSEDDKVWYRNDAVTQPRDNVLVEFGLFAGALGQDRAIVCLKGKPRTPTDLAGVVYADLANPASARASIQAWLESLSSKSLKGANTHAEAAATAGSDLLCADEQNQRSIEGTTAATFTITNRTQQVLTVYWLDYEGQRQEYFRIRPGEKRKQPTYLTHPWVVTDPTGKCIRLFYAPADIVI